MTVNSKCNCLTFSTCSSDTAHYEMMNEPSLACIHCYKKNSSPPPHHVLSQEPAGNHTPPQLSPSVGQAAYTAGVPGGSLDVQHLIMQADARRRQRSNDNYFEDVPRSKLERQMAQVSMVRCLYSSLVICACVCELM